MTTVILILEIFNIGLTLVCIEAGLRFIRRHTEDLANKIIKRTDGDIEQLGTAIFNMDSLKQKANMTGKAEI